AQRYEAASTIYGPHTLSAYIQLFRNLAKAIATELHLWKSSLWMQLFMKLQL
ncbi:ASAH2 isoform 6, partial [Pan troglodytes]